MSQLTSRQKSIKGLSDCSNRFIDREEKNNQILRRKHCYIIQEYGRRKDQGGKD